VEHYDPNSAGSKVKAPFSPATHWTLLNLASSNYSGYFSFPLGQDKAAFGSLPRFVTPFDQVPATANHHPPTDSDAIETEKPRFLVSGEFDSIGIVIGHTEPEVISSGGAVGEEIPSKQRIRQCYFLVDQSMHFLAIHLTTYEESLPNSEHFKQGNIVGFKNMVYKFVLFFPLFLSVKRLMRL